jgi:hypothetical protein
MISTTYLALAASTSMPSMLAGLVVERADRCCGICMGGKGAEGGSVFDDHEKDD